MSPCRTLQWRRPARSSRARASASMSSDRSRPSPRSIAGPNSSSMRPVPVPRSSSERNGLSASAVRDRLLHRFVGDVQLADAVPLGGVARGNSPAPPPRAPRARRRAARGRARWSGRRDRAARRASRASSAAPPRSPSRKKAQEPSRKRSTRPASASSLQMARDARLRLAQDVGEVGDGQLGLGEQREDAQPRLFAGGLERAVEIGKRQLGGRRHRSHGVGLVPNDTAYKDIFIRLIKC